MLCELCSEISLTLPDKRYEVYECIPIRHYTSIAILEGCANTGCEFCCLVHAAHIQGHAQSKRIRQLPEDLHKLCHVFVYHRLDEARLQSNVYWRCQFPKKYDDTIGGLGGLFAVPGMFSFDRCLGVY